MALVSAILLALTLALGGCAEADGPLVRAEAGEGPDLCEQAAEHRASCTGDYVTPPACDAVAQAAAREILATPCDDFTQAFEASGKADGAMCDWFGTGCTPDEPIFGGPTCQRDAACPEGFCAEGRCFDGLASEEFQGVLDLFTGTAEVAGGEARILAKNAEVHAFRREMIAQAKKSVHFSAFIIQDDAAGWEMVADVVQAAQRGVEVRVLVDATTQYTFSSYRLIEQMAQGGVQVLAFNPVMEWALLRPRLAITANDRLHEKMLVVDGQQAILGGRNVGAEYFDDDQWRDVDALVTGEPVAGVQRMFLNIWDKNGALEFQAGCPSQAKFGFFCPLDPRQKLVAEPAYYAHQTLGGSLRTRPLYSDPLVQETPTGYLATIALVRAARQSIVIANSYFVPPRRLRKHLKAAAGRGVRVQILTNSLQSTDAWWMYYASLNYYRELLDAGVEIYQYQGTETMHAKTMVIDAELAVVGSFNLDPRSAIDNSEAMLLFRDGPVVGELQAQMAQDFGSADRVSAMPAMSELLKAKAFRLVEPLL